MMILLVFWMVSLTSLFVNSSCFYSEVNHTNFALFCTLPKMLLEFRVPLPYCVEDPNIGYLYMVMEACRSATGGGEGVEWLEQGV